MDDKDIICDFENLYKAYLKAKRGKSFNGSAARFQISSLDGIHLLKEQLENQAYQMSPYNEFEIYEPKRRLIKSGSFKDKVVQHCLCDNVLMPRLRNIFIENNYAGQVGKGTHYGLNKLKSHMTSFYDEHGLNGWILKCDITKYFYSIDHEILKDVVDRYFSDEYTKWLNHLFIDSTESPGLPLGNQVAQVYALLMLHELDVKCLNMVGYYGRYMDDFFLIHKDKEYLVECLKDIKEDVNKLGLSLNGKTQIVPFRKGISFCGFHHYITSDGKYIRKIKGENKRRIRKKLRRWARAVNEGKMEKEKFYEKYNSWKAHAEHGNCYKLCQSMDLYVQQLLESGGIKNVK